MRVLGSLGDDETRKKHGISYDILGESIQMLEARPDNEAVIFGEAGRMCWMRGVKMETSSMGLLAGLARKLSGGSFFLSHFRGEGEGCVAFSPKKPGHIAAVELDDETVFCEKDSFLAGAGDVEVTVALQQKISAGLFGGEGFILQKIKGSGVVFLCGGGVLRQYPLKEDEYMLVSSAHVAFFEETVSYAVTGVPGLKNVFLGGEGLFIAKLEGPGSIWLQGARIPRESDKVKPAGKN